MNWKRMVGAIGFLVLVFGIFILSTGNFSTTGNVLWELEHLETCDEVAIKEIWDSVFIEGSNGITIFEKPNDATDACRFYAHKIVTETEVLILEHNFQDSSIVGANPLFEEGNVTQITGRYLNLEPSMIEAIEGYDDYYDWAQAQITGVPWVIQNEAEANSIFIDAFDVGVGGDWELGTFLYSFDETIEDSSAREYITGTVSRGNAYASVMSTIQKSFMVAGVSFTEEVDNITIERNSSWGGGLELGEHFVIPDGSTFNVSISNDNISAKFDEEEVSFKPVANFMGNASVVLSVDNGFGDVVYSNTFYVFVVEKINEVPELIKNIENILVPLSGNETINLERYFRDDGDLTYRISDLTGFSASINDYILRLSLVGNFSGFEKARVYADDSEVEIRSNQFYISSVGVSPPTFDSSNTNDPIVDPTINTGGSTPNPASNNQNTAQITDNDPDDSNLFLWLMIAAAVLFLIIVMILIYLLVLRKDHGSTSAPIVKPTPAKPILGAAKPINTIKPKPTPTSTTKPTPTTAPINTPEQKNKAAAYINSLNQSKVPHTV
jgi:hypothetical protein